MKAPAASYECTCVCIFFFFFKYIYFAVKSASLKIWMGKLLMDRMKWRKRKKMLKRLVFCQQSFVCLFLFWHQDCARLNVYNIFYMFNSFVVPGGEASQSGVGWNVCFNPPSLNDDGATKWVHLLMLYFTQHCSGRIEECHYQACCCRKGNNQDHSGGHLLIFCADTTCSLNLICFV